MTYMESKQNKYEVLDVFVYLWKKRKPIILITIIGTFFSIITVLLIENQYKTTALLFPTKYSSIVLHSTLIGNSEIADPTLLGGEGELERMIEILNSDEVAYCVINKYNLSKHYKVDSLEKAKRTKTLKKFKKNVKVQKTKYMAAKIEVIDKNPQMASDIANYMIQVYDSIYSQMLKRRAIELYNVVLNAYKEHINLVNQVKDSLEIYRRKGIYLYGSDVDRLNEAYWKSIGKGTMTPSARKEFEQKKELFERYGEKVRLLEKLSELYYTYLTDLRIKLDIAKINMETDFSRKFIVEMAIVPDKKEYPQRSLIVLTSAVSSFILALLLILLLDL